MQFTEFKITNFKGIENITFNLNKSPNANIYTFVGLNESGKTTILEAINFFDTRNKELSVLKLPGETITDYNSIIPISKRANFTDTISIEATLSLDEEDKKAINETVLAKTKFKKVEPVNTVKYYQKYIYKDSKFERINARWSGFSGVLKEGSSRQFINIGDKYPEDNGTLVRLCYSLMPSILYFPNFLFDFPSKIYVETKETNASSKDKFYIELVQDILHSLDNGLVIQTHIIDRVKSGDSNDKRNLNSLLQQMSKKISDVIFEGWDRIFKRKIKDTRVILSCSVDNDGLVYLEFEIEAPDGIYQINERSLGFRWFFTFLLFTQFRLYRKNTPKNIIYLFDEPASNLHSSAQKQLLKSFENLTKNSKIIYTTHSHHLINPNWLETTYVVKNEGLKLEDPENYNIKKTNIKIESYRDFVINHPLNTAYFQPILDVLDYSPSNLESVPDCIFLEGKNDYYALQYFQDVIFNTKHKLNLAPSTGSGNLDTLISLYLGWGKRFVVLLDSDKAGREQKKRYIEKYGLIIEKAVFTLDEINPTWIKHGMEKMFDSKDLLEFQKTCYPNSEEYNKSHFNRSIQESLINRKIFTFSTNTLENIKSILDFLSQKIM